MRTIRAIRVEADSTQKIREDQDALVVPAILTREGILPFDDGRGYRPASELEAAAWTLEGAWVVAYDHILTVFPMSREDIRGKVENVKFDAGIHGVRGDIRFVKALCDQALLDGVRQGDLKDVSVAYFCEDIFEPGKFAGEPYDFVQRNFMFGHVAAGVPEGRCPSPFCGMNVDSFKPHKDPEVTEDFIHIPVKDADLFIDGSFRTIDIDAGKGIKAVIGKLKSDPKGSTVVQKFIFDKSKDWTMEKAQAWVREHKDSAIPNGPKTDEERAKRHFNLSDEQWNALSEEEKQRYISQLPPVGTQRDQEQGEREKLHEEAARRCARTPIKFKEGKGHLTKPEEYQNVDDDDFADPCNYAYPMVPEDRLRAAWQRLHQEKNRAAGDYTSEEWEWMKNRVEKRLKEKGAEVKADSLDPVEVLAHSRRLLNSW